jgi:hypothetical protein
MKADTATKAAVLTAMLAEDRTEVRTIYGWMYGLTSAFTLASFTLTSLLLRPESISNAAQARTAVHIACLMDICIVPLIWGIYWILKRQVLFAQQCVELRQRLLDGLGESKEGLEIAPPVTQEAGIRHSNLIWFPTLVSVVLIFQAVVLLVGL